MAGARSIEPTKPTPQAWQSALRPKACRLALHEQAPDHRCE